MNSPSKNLPNRLPEFDLLRSLSIIGVVIIHSTTVLQFYALNGIFMYYLFVVIHLSQRFCVPVFLIISGFFLTYKIDNGQNPTSVLQRRLTRIIPPYIIWSVVFSFFDIARGNSQAAFLSVITNLLTGSAVGGYYFIILIIQFYFLWWLLIKFRVLNYTKLLIISAVVQLLVSLYFSFYLYTLHYFPWMDLMYRSVFAWSFYFVIGLFLGENYDATKRIMTKAKKVLMIITPLLLLLSVVEFNSIYGLELFDKMKHITQVLYINDIPNIPTVDGNKLEAATSYWRISSQLYSVAFFLLILSFYESNFVKTKAAKFFNKLPEFSFSIYLLHYVIVWKLYWRVSKLLGTGTLASFVVLLVLTLGICYSFVYFSGKNLPKKYTRYLLGL